MNTETRSNSIAGNQSIDLARNENIDKEDFKPGATIAVLTLLIAFVASSVYILISGYLNVV